MISKFSAQLFFFLLLIVVPLGYSQAIQDHTMLPKYLLLAMVLCSSSLLFFKSFEKDSFKISWPTGLLIAYLALACFSISAAFNPSDAVYETSKILLFGGTFILSKVLIDRNRERALKAIASFSFMAIIITILFSTQELFEALRRSEPFSSTVYLVKGLHGHKNLLAGWLMLLIPLSALAYYVKTKIPKVLLSLVLTLTIIFLFLLQTRAALVGFFLGASLFLIANYSLKGNKSKQHLRTILQLSFALIAMFILLTVLSPVTESFLKSLHFDSASSQERIILWHKTIALIKQHSFFGIGGGNWKILFPSTGLSGLYRAELNNVIFLRPHNDLLWIWVQYGLLSLLAYLGFLFMSLSKGVEGILKKDAFSKSKLMGFIGVFAYLGMSFFDFPMERMEHQIALAILIALVVSDNDQVKEPVKNKRISRFIALPLSVLSAACIFLGYNRYEAEVHLKKVMTFKEQGNHQMLINEAQSIDQRFIQLDHNAIPINWYMGNAYFNLGSYNDAINNYEHAVNLNPYNFNVLNNAGTGYILKKEYEKAIPYFMNAHRINPAFDDAKLNLASIYINLGQHQTALDWLNQLRIKSARSEQLRQIIQNN